MTIVPTRGCHIGVQILIEIAVDRCCHQHLDHWPILLLNATTSMELSLMALNVPTLVIQGLNW